MESSFGETKFFGYRRVKSRELDEDSAGLYRSILSLLGWNYRKVYSYGCILEYNRVVELIKSRLILYSIVMRLLVRFSFH